MPNPISITAQIACIRREITMRLHVYPGLVRKGRMTQAQMDHELACMQAVLQTLQPEPQPGLLATSKEP